MKLKRIISLMLIAIIATSLIGCEKFYSKNKEEISAKEVDKEVVEGNNKFAFNLL